MYNKYKINYNLLNKYRLRFTATSKCSKLKVLIVAMAKSWVLQQECIMIYIHSLVISTNIMLCENDMVWDGFQENCPKRGI